MVTPAKGVRVVDGLHEPRSSHLWMLTAIAGEDLLGRVYAEALAGGYRWLEFGDVNLLLSRPTIFILSYDPSMTVKERITVTIDADIAARLKELAGSTSSFVEAAIREKLDRQRNARTRLAEMLAAHERRDPAAFAESQARVRRRLGLPTVDDPR